MTHADEGTNSQKDYSKGITQENFNSLLNDFAKEFRKQNGSKTPAEIIIVGGASIVSNYGFREATQDIDIVAQGSSAIQDAILKISDSHHLPTDWMNADFIKTASYSDKIIEHSSHYRSYYGGLLEIRTIRDEYLIAMKMMSGREYKHDISDIIGILYESKAKGKSISNEMIDRAIVDLYGNAGAVKPQILERVHSYTNLPENDLRTLYEKLNENEAKVSETLLDMDQKYVGIIREDTVDDIVARIQRKMGLRGTYIKDEEITQKPMKR